MKRAKRDAPCSIKLTALGVAAATTVLLTTGHAAAQERPTRAMIGGYAGYLFGTSAEGESHQVVDLVTAIAEGNDPHPTFADGLQVQRVLAAVETSSDTRSWQEVPA